MNTTSLGIAKIAFAIVLVIAAVAVGIATHDWTAILGILSGGGVLSGVISGMIGIKADDAQK